MDHAEVSAPAGVEKVTPAVEQRHSPTPWHLVRYAGELVVHDANDELVMTVEEETDAVLAVAAPDLLEALKDLVAWKYGSGAQRSLLQSDFSGGDGILGYAECEALIEANAKAAIAKARTIPPGT